VSDRLSVRMIQAMNCSMDLDEIWYERYAVGVYLKSYLLIYIAQDVKNTFLWHS
jgi:hypothetical protein